MQANVLSPDSGPCLPWEGQDRGLLVGVGKGQGGSEWAGVLTASVTSVIWGQWSEVGGSIS